MLKLSQCFNSPELEYRTIHVAGTNGKGSVATKIAKALQLEGYQVGLYTSPHISSFRERISIDFEIIEQCRLEEILKKIFGLLEEKEIFATFFEIATMLAMLYFREKNVDIAVFEVGLGGRLDATNIISPLISVITSISRDHEDILGNTIEAITKEKAGIIKPKVPIIIGPRVRADIIHKISTQLHSPFYQVQEEYKNFDEENTAIAKRALEVLSGCIALNPCHIEEGIQARPDCRFQIIHKDAANPLFKRALPDYVVLDVAHNPDGINHLFYLVNQKFPGKKKRVLMGLSKNKDILGCLKCVISETNELHFVEAKNGRAASVKELVDIAQSLDIKDVNIIICDTTLENIEKAIALAAQEGEVLVCCGTFFIMGEVRKILGIEAFEDPVELNEAFLSSSNKTPSKRSY